MFHLRVEDLRQAGGRVRCGECNHVFYGMDYLAEEPEGETQPEEILFTSDDSRPAENADEVGAAMAMLTNPDLTTDAPVDKDADESDEWLSADAEISSDAWKSEPEEPESTEETYEETEEETEPETAWIADVGPEEAIDTSAEISADLAGAQPDEIDQQWSAAADTDESDAYAVQAEEPDGEDAEDVAADFDIDDTIWEKIPGVGTIATDTGTGELAELEHDDTGEFLTTELLAVAENDGTAAEIEVLTKTADEAEPDDDIEENANDEDEDSDLEFNVPEEEWSTVFETSSDFAATADGDTEDEAEHIDTQSVEAQTPPWQFDKYRNVDLDHYNSYAGFWTICLAVLAVILIGQLVHYNRDSLAAHPAYGENIRNLYAFLDLPLYPRWSIDDYEIRGSEAVVGETGPDVMDIRTQIAAVGDHAIGLPVLRVVLRDRWSNPVAERNFGALEYAARADLPADNLLQPNSSLAARLSIIDPGSGAQGYELELCVPYRGNRLECSGQAFK
jgi:predicted Zn finger-like uncharacterized protein